MSDFILEPGMKVECIDNDLSAPGRFWVPSARPVMGAIYTVHGILPRRHDEDCIELVELKNPHEWTGAELGYKTYRFRPIKSRDTDITIFREIDADVFRKVSA